ncbi:CRAL/TRIO domain [Babesia microti strain RI]|uniref:CRAL/TRIO domain n=1 Tax=Babesia microti (strain RI) TaxID=1133968 RepID=A0A1N6LY35_BABMR|nr:CRAL/TRIO domain [Babesia microti strain RI]SIO73796.1 CRAL/TRIO domain [Babesia microti strain RI]|eukprot:XP_021337856.1 CRAL/TRIO domain [Babesia microti strain RI]
MTATTKYDKERFSLTTLTEREQDGLVSALSDAEMKLLQAVKNRYIAEVASNVGVFDDIFFVRFLRARGFDEGKTCKMLDKYFKWRTDFKVNELIKSNFIERMLYVKKHYPHGYHGVDKLGRPMYIERMGVGNVPELMKVLSQEQILQYYVQLYEYLKHVILPACSIAANKCVEQAVTIIDLKGVSVTSINGKTKSLVQGMAKMSQDYFPEILGKMLFVNASSIFSIIWAIVKPLLDSKTIKKVTVISSKEKSLEALAELADPDQLPQFLGGACPNDEWSTNAVGPWMDPQIIRHLQDKYTSVPVELYDLAYLRIKTAATINLSDRDLGQL